MHRQVRSFGKFAVAKASHFVLCAYRNMLNAEVLRYGILTDPELQQDLLATAYYRTEALEATFRSAQLQQTAQSSLIVVLQHNTTDNFHSIDIGPLSQLTQGDCVGAFLTAL